MTAATESISSAGSFAPRSWPLCESCGRAMRSIATCSMTGRSHTCGFCAGSITTAAWCHSADHVADNHGPSRKEVTGLSQQALAELCLHHTTLTQR
jgi:hypothetical protein